MGVITWVNGDEMPREGRWLWTGQPGRFHRYHDDGTSWCGEGPAVDSFETKTPGGPWCSACIDMTRGGGAASRRAHNPESPVRSRASQPTGATTEVDHGEEEQGRRQRQGREGLLAPNVAHEARGQLLGPDLVCFPVGDPRRFERGAHDELTRDEFLFIHTY